MNRLAGESSPYLLQHAHNPVDWYPYGEEALQRALREDKLILVSVGYAACHWCHVMERESFEQEDVARLMNAGFVNIKIDREERPDLDHIYMDALQAMTGSGGWPLNLFLTPDGRPFYGGTYFPPARAYGRLSWKETLQEVSRAFRERRPEIETQAGQLTEHLSTANAFGLPGAPGPAEASASPVTRAHLDGMFEALMQQADLEEGGFGKAPKFPQTFSIQWLIRYAHFTGEQRALDHAVSSLEHLITGGIYDQLGGGMARYSTDSAWLVPHFEKMLYDNALLVSVLCEAFGLTRAPWLERAIRDVLSFAEREWLVPGEGFCAAWDADSEGVEGKYYTWTKAEIDSLLGEDTDRFCRLFGVTEAGNWEGVNILHRLTLSPEDQDLFERSRSRLLTAREKRIRPLLDDKQLLSWNALMNKAFSQAFAATGEPRYRDLAVRHMAVMLRNYRLTEGLGHVFKAGMLRYPAFLDDYAYLIQALVCLQEVTADPAYLYEAKRLTEYVIAHFSEPATGYFYFTHSAQKGLLFRKKEVYDGATPSGNAVMAWNLRYLSVILDQPTWRTRADAMLRGVLPTLIRYPGSFGVWGDLALQSFYGMNEVAIVGEGYANTLREVLGLYIPNRILQAGVKGDPRFPLLEGKGGDGATWIYLCRNYTCGAPVADPGGLMQQIRRAAQ